MNQLSFLSLIIHNVHVFFFLEILPLFSFHPWVKKKKQIIPFSLR